MENKKIGFLFDLDGVIIDSEPEYTRIWAQINKEFPTGIQDFEHVIKGCTLSKILEENYKDDDVRSAVSSRLHELEDKMKYNYMPHAHEFLDILKERKLLCVLVTSSDNKKMTHLYDELPEIKDYFSFIVTGDLVKNSKPSPEGYLLGAAKIGCHPQNCVVFEDSLQGVMAGNNAGAYVVGMEGTLPADILAPFSHIIIKGFDELNLNDLILKLYEQ